MVRTVSQERRNDDGSHGRDRRAIHAGRRRLHGSVCQRQMALADGTPSEAETQAASTAGEDERDAKGRPAFGIADESATGAQEGNCKRIVNAPFMLAEGGYADV